MKILFALLMVLIAREVVGAPLRGVRDFSVHYKKMAPSLLGLFEIKNQENADDTTIGIQSVSASFKNFTALVGLPGSGKSTLAKALHRSCADIDKNLRIMRGKVICDDNEMCLYNTAYINEFFYETYSASMKVDQICFPLLKTESTRKIYEICLATFDLRRDAQIIGLMESQKRCFELMLALLRTQDERDHGVPRSRQNPESGDDKTRGSNNQCLSQTTPSSALLLLDEFFDKDIPAVVRRVFTTLRKLRRALESEVLLQVVTISHCQVVADSSDWVVVIHKGSVFHEQVSPQLRLPDQFEWRK